MASARADGGRWELARQWGGRLLASATVASMVALTTFLWAPLEMLASIVSVNFEGELDDMRTHEKMVLREVAIVTVTPEHYAQAYGARSPLDRCVFAKDIKSLLVLPTIRAVAIDFDLSPYRVPQGNDIQCQEDLDHVLLDFAKTKSLIVLRPGSFMVKPPAEVLAMVEAWEQKMAAGRVQFGHPAFIRSFGIPRAVRAQKGQDRALSLAFRQALFNDDDSPREERQIAVRADSALYRMGEQLPLDKLCETDALERKICPSLQGALVGSAYSRDDRFLTLSHERLGVDLHAAIAACHKAGATHLQHFLLDVVIGVFLGWVFGLLWTRYFETASGDRAKRLAQENSAAPGFWGRVARAITPRDPEAAYGWFFWMLLVILVLIAAVGWLSLQIFGGACATAIFPAGIVIGMLIEAAVVQGPEIAAHRMQHASANHSAATAHGVMVQRPLRSRLHAWFKTGAAMAFSLSTFLYLLQH